MKKLIFFILMAVSFISYAQDADSMLKEVESVMYPDNYYSVMTMVTIRPGKDDVSMTMEVYYKDGVGSFIEITEPSRSSGIRFLQKEETLWMFNPRSNSRRAVRLSPKESFQGSAFSNNDVGDPEYSDDYNSTILSETKTIDNPELGNVECYVLQCIASHREAAYDRIDIYCTKDGYLPVRFEYYTKSGMLYRVMEFSGFKNIAGRTRPTVMVMEAMDQQGTYSRLDMEELEIRDDLSDNMFTQNSLTR
jgi:outer membrane lipoprotein-sorting protein